MLKRMLRMLASLILLGTILISGSMLEVRIGEYRMEKQIKTELSTEVRTGRKVNFERLLEKNADVKAWIFLPESQIDYPVVQAEDND